MYMSTNFYPSPKMMVTVNKYNLYQTVDLAFCWSLQSRQAVKIGCGVTTEYLICTLDDLWMNPTGIKMISCEHNGWY